MPNPIPPAVGDPVPPLDLPAMDGGRIHLPREPGRPVIISFLRHAG